MDEDGAFFMAIAFLFIVGFSGFGCYATGSLDGKHELFRDIANQRCAPQVALISADNPYRYVCVEKR